MKAKQEQIVKTALRLFYNKGVHAVGINEILADSGVAKRTLYNYYKTKEDLVVATLEYRDALFMQWLTERMNRMQYGAEALVEIFYALDDWFNDRCDNLADFRGCYFINVAAEYSEPESKVFQATKKHKVKVRRVIAEHASVLQKDGSEAEAVIDTIVMLKEGAIVSALLQEDRDAAKRLIPVVQKIVAQK